MAGKDPNDSTGELMAKILGLKLGTPEWDAEVKRVEDNIERRKNLIQQERDAEDAERQQGFDEKKRVREEQKAREEKRSNIISKIGLGAIVSYMLFGWLFSPSLPSCGIDELKYGVGVEMVERYLYEKEGGVPDYVSLNFAKVSISDVDGKSCRARATIMRPDQRTAYADVDFELSHRDFNGLLWPLRYRRDNASIELRRYSPVDDK